MKGLIWLRMNSSVYDSVNGHSDVTTSHHSRIIPIDIRRDKYLQRNSLPVNTIPYP